MMDAFAGTGSQQVDIAREVASAIDDDFTEQETSKKNESSGGNQRQQQVEQPLSFVSSDSGSFVRISTPSTEALGQGKLQHGAGTALSFDEEALSSSSNILVAGHGHSHHGHSHGDGTSCGQNQKGAGEGGAGTGVWSWISNAVGGDIVETTQRLGRNLVQKTKNSMDTVITTLDPGMEDYLHKSGPDCINLVLTSTDEDIIEGMKDGFKQMFGHVSMTSQQSRSSLAPLPNSFSSALKSAKQRITNLHSSSTQPEVDIVVAAVEEFIVEIMPQKWFGMMCFCLQDNSRKIETETFSQAFSLPNNIIKNLEELTPSHYSLRWSGLSVSLGEVLQNNWTKYLTGVPKRQVVTLAAKTLAGQYKEAIERSSSKMEKSITL